MKLASLNMRGYGNQNVRHSGNKWNHINQIMRDKKLAFLIVQETHMDEERQHQVEQLFSKRMKVFSTANPENPTGKGGVAIVLNKHNLETDSAQSSVIVAGRALLLRTKFHHEEKISILAIYAPNDPGENRDFWKTILTYFQEHPNIPKPDIMAGDFNMVDDAIDRLPTHNDFLEIVNAFDELKSELGLRDGWRATYPDSKAFTYQQTNGGTSQSRIDRIYVKNQILNTARE